MADVFDMPGAHATFEQRGGWVLNRLVAEFDLKPFQAAGICGNLGGESGLRAVQEVSPMVAGSRGGFGWAQWTGPRRRAYETWCAMHDYDVASDQANYGFLVEELKTTQANVITKLKDTSTIEAATYVVEAVFERPADLQSGLASRITFAKRALIGSAGLSVPAPDADNSADALNHAEAQKHPPIVALPPPAVPPSPASAPIGGAHGATVGGGIVVSLSIVLMWLSHWPLQALDSNTSLALAGLVVAAFGLCSHQYSNSGDKS